MKHQSLLFASFLVAAAAGLPQTGKLNCPPGFTLLGTSCYFVSQETHSGASAEQFCQGFGGYAAVIDTPEEMDSLKGSLLNQTVLQGVPAHTSQQEPEKSEDSGYTNVLCQAEVTATQKSCAHGHLFQESTCFWLDGNKIYSWREAVATCADIGMTIASVHSPEENAFIFGVSYSSSMWIGLNDLVREGNFNWADGTAVDYTNWFDGGVWDEPPEPDHGNDSNCVFMHDYYNGGWGDDPCSTKWGVVCRGVPN